jgi:phage-related protein
MLMHVCQYRDLLRGAFQFCLARMRRSLIGSSRDDLRALPQQVRRDIGQALYAAQQGETDPSAKPLKGFGGSRVMEIVERYRTDAYRAVYTAHLRMRSMFCMCFRRNRGAALRRRSRTSR